MGSVRNLPTTIAQVWRKRRSRSQGIFARGGLRRVGKDVGELAGPDVPLPLGDLVEGQPEHEPDEPDRTRDQEGGRPAEADGDPGHDGRGDHGPDIGPGVEDARGQRPLPAGEPLGHGLDRRREVPGLAEPEGEAGDAEGQGAPGGRVGHGRDAPEADGQGVADPGPETVDEPAEGGEADGISDLEGGDDVAILDLAPADLLLQVRRQDAEDLPVDVIDGGGGEQQPADGPAEMPGTVVFSRRVVIGFKPAWYHIPAPAKYNIFRSHGILQANSLAPQSHCTA